MEMIPVIPVYDSGLTYIIVTITMNFAVDKNTSVNKGPGVRYTEPLAVTDWCSGGVWYSTTGVLSFLHSLFRKNDTGAEKYAFLKLLV